MKKTRLYMFLFSFFLMAVSAIGIALLAAR
jgi:hypothetical protein